MNNDWKANKEFWRTFAGEVADEEHLKQEVLETYDSFTQNADDSWSYNKFKIAAFDALYEWDIQ